MRTCFIIFIHLSFALSILLPYGCMPDHSVVTTESTTHHPAFNTHLRSLSESSESIKILPLGDSRVEGSRPDYESYRYELWKILLAEQWNFDFVGPLEDEQEYPMFMQSEFDRDHAGVGGFTTEDILTHLPEMLDHMEAADVVLLGIGGNDLLGEISVATAIENMESIITLLQEVNPHVIIIIEHIAPARSDIMTEDFSELLEEFNLALIDLVETHNHRQNHEQQSGAHLMLVDMQTGWGDEYLADDVHYNAEGAAFIANHYYQALQSLIDTACDQIP